MCIPMRSAEAALCCKLLLLFVACNAMSACTKMRAHVEDQNIDPAASQRTLVRGEQSGCNLSEQLISNTVKFPGKRRAVWKQFE